MRLWCCGRGPGRETGRNCTRAASLRCVKGSHKWPRAVLPTRWLSETDFYPDDKDFMPVPDPDAEGMEIAEFEMAPGDYPRMAPFGDVQKCIPIFYPNVGRSESGLKN